MTKILGAIFGGLALLAVIWFLIATEHQSLKQELAKFSADIGHRPAPAKDIEPTLRELVNNLHTQISAVDNDLTTQIAGVQAEVQGLPGGFEALINQLNELSAKLDALNNKLDRWGEELSNQISKPAPLPPPPRLVTPEPPKVSVPVRRRTRDHICHERWQTSRKAFCGTPWGCSRH